MKALKRPLLSDAILLFFFIFLSSIYSQSFKQHTIGTISKPKLLKVADMDNDGEDDVVVAAPTGAHQLVWYENPTWNSEIIRTNLGAYDYYISIGDMDSDGDNDVITNSFNTNTVMWIENPGWIVHPIDNNFNGAAGVYAIDMNGDDTLDVVAAGSYANELVWYKGPNWNKVIIDSSVINLPQYADNVWVIDIDADLDLDIFHTAATLDLKIGSLIFYENENDSAWTKTIIDPNAGWLVQMDFGDLDGDNSLEVVSTCYSQNKVVMYDFPSWNRSDITVLNEAIGVGIGDIDLDDTLDVVASGQSTTNTVRWYEGPNWNRHDIYERNDNSHALVVTDLDKDNDMDIVASIVQRNQVVWFENNTTGIKDGGFEFDGHQRDYMVYLPNNYTENSHFPLVIYLHCYGWTAQQGMDYTLLHQVADTSDFIVVYPSAIPNWNSGIGDNKNWPTPSVNDVGFIDALIDTLDEHYSIDLEKIYACGYSNGGFMSYKLACELNHRIAAIASVGGVISNGILTNCNPHNSIPVLQIHGTEDPWVPINGAEGWNSVDQTLEYWINFNNCIQMDTTILPDLDTNDNCTVEKIVYTNCSNNSKIIYYKVINGGHTWPGAGPPGYPAGNTNHDIKASVEIWNFFENYKRVSSIGEPRSKTPLEYALIQNYPNPFNPSTTIEFSLPKSDFVVLKVYNILGKEVSTLVSKKLNQGNHTFIFDGMNLASGIYYYQLVAGEFHKVKKMILLK